MSVELIIRLIADYAVIPVVLIGAYTLIIGIPKGQRFAAYSRVLMAGLTAYLFAKLIGTVYQPAEVRPFESLGVAPGALYLDNPGFPSDHSLFVVAITCAVWFETRRFKTTIVLVALALLVCVGRVVALVHTPLDVVGGVFIALLGALWYSNQPKGGRRLHHGKSRHKQ